MKLPRRSRPTARKDSAASTERVLRTSPFSIVSRDQPKPTGIYRTLWSFACERQAIFDRRLAGELYPWTRDPILQAHRFTNAYRVSDRVSQYLIRHVIYAPELPHTPSEVLYRILLFKLFNRIDTWELLQTAFGPLVLDSFRFEEYSECLGRAKASGQRIYSAAYIMPSTGILGEANKHRGHLRLIERMVNDRLDLRILAASSLSEIYDVLLSYPTLGPFLAFQLAIDFNYAEVIKFSEMDFVVAGPGALDGLHKCFASFGDYDAADVIRWVTDRQEHDLAKLGLNFSKLFGRRLQLIDVQNLFCELSKYARVAHPNVIGITGRLRIKQAYRPELCHHKLFYPPKWGINGLIPETVRATATPKRINENKFLFVDA